MADPYDDSLDESLATDEELLDPTQTEWDLLFPVVPLEDLPLGPDETDDPEELVDDLGDFGEEDLLAAEDDDDASDPEAEDEEYREDFAFDWDTEEFLMDGIGTPLRVADEDAIVEWAMKALNTERGEYAIYSEDYGCDLKKLLGSSMGEPILSAEIARTVRECLLQHPRITGAEVESVRPQPAIPDALFVDIAFWIDGDDEPIEMELATP